MANLWGARARAINMFGASQQNSLRLPLSGFFLVGRDLDSKFSLEIEVLLLGGILETLVGDLGQLADLLAGGRGQASD